MIDLLSAIVNALIRVIIEYVPKRDICYAQFNIRIFHDLDMTQHIFCANQLFLKINK